MDFEDILSCVKSETDMKQTLDVLGIKEVKGAFLCPFHNDKHIGNCRILHKDYGMCFACNTGFDSIKLVQKVNGTGFRDAVLFIYENVLGYPSPTVSSKKTDCVLTFQELRFLGLNGPMFAKTYAAADVEERQYLEEALLRKAKDRKEIELAKRKTIYRKSAVLKEAGMYQGYMEKSVSDLNETEKLLRIISKSIAKKEEAARS